MDNKLVAKELINVAKKLLAFKSLPNWVVKTFKGMKKTAPYVFKANTEFAMDNLGDLASWCHENGCRQAKIFNTSNGRFIKITDPLCRELELAGLIEE